MTAETKKKFYFGPLKAGLTLVDKNTLAIGG